MRLGTILNEAFGMKQLKAGDKVMAGYRDWKDKNTFLGFSDDSKKYGEGGPKYDTQAELLKAQGVSKLSDLEGKSKNGFYALFKSDDGDSWGAYIYKGRWCVGTSADTLKVAPADAVTEQLVIPSVGNLGHMLVLDDNVLVKELAKALGVNDGWELTPVGNVFAAYNSGDRLVIFENEGDFDAE